MLFRSALFFLIVLAPDAVIAQRVPDESGLRSLFQDQEAAWNRGDGVAFAAAFTEDSDFINLRGDLFVAILSEPLKGSHNVITIRTLTPVSEERTPSQRKERRFIDAAFNDGSGRGAKGNA